MRHSFLIIILHNATAFHYSAKPHCDLCVRPEGKLFGAYMTYSSDEGLYSTESKITVLAAFSEEVVGVEDTQVSIEVHCAVHVLVALVLTKSKLSPPTIIALVRSMASSAWRPQVSSFWTEHQQCISLMCQFQLIILAT